MNEMVSCSTDNLAASDRKFGSEWHKCCSLTAKPAVLVAGGLVGAWIGRRVD
jgi:hypothetical protein